MNTEQVAESWRKECDTLKDCIVGLEKANDELLRTWQKELHRNAELESELAANTECLARQTDLARVAETRAMELSNDIDITHATMREYRDIVVQLRDRNAALESDHKEAESLIKSWSDKLTALESLNTKIASPADALRWMADCFDVIDAVSLKDVSAKARIFANQVDALEKVAEAARVIAKPFEDRERSQEMCNLLVALLALPPKATT